MENSREVGGNKLLFEFGYFLLKIGEKCIDKGRSVTITNPSCRFINPFTLLTTFTINNLHKYQLITQGDYKEKYKQFGTDEDPITNDEMFEIIIAKQKDWFLKN